MQRVLIVRLGADHSFGNKLLKVERQHIQVAQHPDTNAMLLQILPLVGERDRRRTIKKKSTKQNMQNKTTV